MPQGWKVLRSRASTRFHHRPDIEGNRTQTTPSVGRGRGPKHPACPTSSGSAAEGIGNRDVVLTTAKDSCSTLTALKGVDRNGSAVATNELSLNGALDHIPTNLALNSQADSDGTPPLKQDGRSKPDRNT